MNLEEKTHLLAPPTSRGNSFVSKISQILSACECTKNLMISIYLLEQKRFLFCNNKLKDILAESCSKLIKRGWDYWFSMIDPKEVVYVKNRITDFCSLPYPQNQMTLQYHITDVNGKKICVKHELLLHQMEQQYVAINYFFDVSEKEKIEHCFETSAKKSNVRSTQNRVFTISPRERQVLKLIADGFSSKEIADMLYISNHTAVSHRKNLIEKFQVKNTAHLVKRALGLLQE